MCSWILCRSSCQITIIINNCVTWWALCWIFWCSGMMKSCFSVCSWQRQFRAPGGSGAAGWKWQEEEREKGEGKDGGTYRNSELKWNPCHICVSLCKFIVYLCTWTQWACFLRGVRRHYTSEHWHWRVCVCVCVCICAYERERERERERKRERERVCV